MPAIPLEGIYIWTQLSESPIQVEAQEEDWPETQDIFHALPSNPVVTVIGDPGAGKSTFVNFLIQQLAQPTQNPTRDALKGKIPIPLVIRELKLDEVKDWETLLQAFYRWPGAAALREFGSRPGSPLESLEIIENILRNGNGYVIVDGFDEAPGTKARETLAVALLEAQALYADQDNRWLVTSRPVGYDQEPFLRLTTVVSKGELASDHSGSLFEEAGEIFAVPKALKIQIEVSKRRDLSRFSSFEGASSNLTDIQELVVRAKNYSWYYGTTDSVGQSAKCLYVAPFREEEVKRFAVGWFGARSKGPQEAEHDQAQFIAKIRSQSNLREMARLPQLLSMMCLVYLIDRSLPDGRADLFKRVTAVYLEQIPTLVSASVKYPLKQAEQWLARVGFEMQKLRASSSDQNGSRPSAAVVAREKILEWIGQEQTRLGHDPAGADDFLHFASTRGGLFLERGEGQLAFLHLAFQEYFAALFLRDTLRWDPAPVQGRASRYASVEAQSTVSRAEILEAAARIEWQESFVLLFELYSEREIPSALAALMDEAQTRVDANRASKRTDPSAANLIQMLGRIAADSTVRLSQSARADTAAELLQWEGAHQSRLLNKSRQSSDSLSLLGDPMPLLAWGKDNFHDEEQRRVSKIFSRLYLRGTNFTELSPLAGLSSLEMLSISNFAGSDLSPLVSLKRLKTLNLQHTMVSDLSPLRHFKALRALSLHDTPVSDLSALEDLGSLETLSLYSTMVSDLSPLRHFKALRALSLHDTPVSDLSALEDLGSLETLNAHGVSIFNLSPLANLRSLKTLNLHEIVDSDLSFLRGLTLLGTLSLRGSKISDLSVLADLEALESLSVYGVSITDLSPLACLSHLNYLGVEGDSITDLSPLRPLNKITSLHLNTRRVSDLGPLDALTTLTSLDIRRVIATDLSPISNLVSLESLLLQDIEATDLRPISALKNLRDLYLYNNRIEDLSPLENLRSLRSIYLFDTAASEDSIQALKKVLTNTSIHKIG